MNYFLIFLSLLFISNLYASPYYGGVSGGWFKTRDIESWGGGAYLGYEVSQKNQKPDCTHLGLELELMGIYGDNQQDEIYNFSANEALVGGFHEINYQKVEFTQIPAFINLRFWSPLSESAKFSWYAGLGVGSKWTESKNHIYFKLIDPTGTPVPLADNPSNEKKVDNTIKNSRWRFVGQLFAGLGYKMDMNWSINVGVRALFSPKEHWQGPPPTKNSPFKGISTKTSVVQLGVDLGLNYSF